MMKTEQEIMQMVNTCNNYYSCALCPYNPEDISRFIGDRWKGGCPNCDRKLVYAMGKGYGNISEYKAEIERLKANINQAQDQILETAQKNQEYREQQVKQAQIDVLNQLKERAIGYTFLGEKLATETDIDELIKEVQNAEDKS